MYVQNFKHLWCFYSLLVVFWEMPFGEMKPLESVILLLDSLANNATCFYLN